MIPTPAKRRQQHQQEHCVGGDCTTMQRNNNDHDDDQSADSEEESTNDEDESSSKFSRDRNINQVFIKQRRISNENHRQNLCEANEELESFELAGEEEEEDMMLENGDEDDFDDYMRLDTIVEEDESGLVQSDNNNGSQQRQKAHDSSDEDDCDTTSKELLRHTKAQLQQQVAHTTATNAVLKQADESTCEGPPTESRANLADNSDSTGSRRTLVDGSALRNDVDVDVDGTNNKTDSNNKKCDISQQHQANKTGSQTTSVNSNKDDKMARRLNGYHNGSLSAAPLPSTNRLISEHQVRQQQALFRALAERQKLMDELGAASGERVDLMSAASLSESLRAATTLSSARRTARKKRSSTGGYAESHSSEESGVPLSAVDLSSMSDRMLDELLGHIASASSSSLSSNGESLDSSDLSNVSDSSDEEADGPRTKPALESQQTAPASRRKAASANDAPNVIGVHEDERTRANGTTRLLQLNCRDAYRRTARNGRDDDDHDADDDDDNHDHELLQVQVGAGADLSDSLSPTTSEQRRQALLAESLAGSNRAHQTQPNQTLRLEDYFTRNLVNAHEAFSQDEASESEHEHDVLQAHRDNCTTENGSLCEPSCASVEEVLLKMLEALNEIGTENQAELNGLLERGFAHLEQLLNCSLTQSAPIGITGANYQRPAVVTQAPLASNAANTTRSQQPTLAQKLISSHQANNSSLLNSTSATISKDSDYGSDTQSADCFSQYADNAPANNHSISEPAQQVAAGGTGAKWQVNAASESPSPSSLTTSSSAQHSTTSSASSSASSSSANCSSPSKMAAKPSDLARQGASTATPATTQLSPLAIELSFKLAESLHRLAQQQQQQQPQQQVEHPAREQPRQVQSETKQQVPAKKSPMKSIVMINAARPSSASSIVSSSSSSVELSTARNLTPVERVEPQQQQQQQRAQFKTCVNIGAAKADEVSNVIVASNATCRNAAGVMPRQIDDLISKQASGTSEVAVEQDKDNNGQQVQQVAASDSEPQKAHFVSSQLRRSARSSLRRRPSFSGSCVSISAAKEPRPGSPVPRPLAGSLAAGEPQAAAKTMGNALAAKVSAESSASNATSGKLNTNNTAINQHKQQKQLQRALVLAQKYNYSPAKLAASKLSSKLQLREPSASRQQHTGTTEPDACLDTNGQWKSGRAPPVGSQHELDRSATLTNKQLQANQTTSLVGRQAICVTGQVQLDISYFAKSGSLTVHVLQCTKLAPVSKRRTTSNPYVKLYLLPDRTKSGKRKSAIHRNELNPKFDEKFTFGPLQLAEFEDRILWLSVWHKDRLGRSEFLGEILLPLGQVRHQLLSSDLCQSTSSKWYQLCDRFDSLLARQQQQTRSSEVATCRTISGQPSGAVSASGRQIMLAGSSKFSEQQQQQVDRLSELQRKAAILTTAVAPPGGFQSNYSLKFLQDLGQENSAPSEQAHLTMMNVSLGPIPKSLSEPNQALISGQLFVALKFVPQNQELLSRRGTANMEGELQVIVKEAHNIAGFEAPFSTLPLSSVNSNGSPDKQQLARAPPSGPLPNPFCKCYLLASNGQRVAKQRTAHLKRTANPRWDQKCVFDSLKLASLSSQAIEIQMFNRGSILAGAGNEYLGGIRLCRRSQAPAGSMDQCSRQSNTEQQVVTGEPQALGSQVAFDSASIQSDQSANNNNSSDSASLRRLSSGTTTTSSNTDSSTMARSKCEPDSLCSEREARLWEQMLTRPNIWVYGELRLRPLTPLIAASAVKPTQKVQ